MNAYQPVNDTVLGIYMPNGIFAETAENSGISYLLDHLIYEKLAVCIDDQGSGQAHCFTQYGYSGFQVVCPPELAKENLQIMQDVLLNELLPMDTAPEWVNSRKQFARKTPVPVDTLYYAKRLPDTPLGTTLSAALTDIPAQKTLENWRSRYYTQDAIQICVSGDSAGLQNRLAARICDLPRYTPVTFGLPKQLPWRRSHMILGYACEMNADQILTAEALCRWLRPQLAEIVNRNNGQLLGVKIHPNFVSEIQISLQCAKGKEQSIADAVTAFLSSAAITETEADALQREVFRQYRDLREAALPWNRFMGEMALLYGKSAEMLLDKEFYRQQITAPKLNCLLTALRQKGVPCVFATAVR